MRWAAFTLRIIVALAVPAAAGGAAAQPAPARAYCAGGGSAAARPTPAALVPLVAAAFGIDAALAQRGSSVRCIGPRLMACSVGANLVCGKADRGRALAGATAFCRDNPGADIVPMVATGHATVYDWSCRGRRAVAGRPSVEVDGQGYIAGNWREIR